MRRHQVPASSGGSLGATAAPEGADLKSLGNRLVSDALESLRGLKANKSSKVAKVHAQLSTGDPKKTAQQDNVATSTASGHGQGRLPLRDALSTARQKDPFVLEAHPLQPRTPTPLEARRSHPLPTKEALPGNTTRFDSVWEEAHHAMNVRNFICTTFAWQGKCDQGETSGFDGLAPADCWGSCLSIEHGNGETAGDSGYVSMEFSFPSSCFCCRSGFNITTTSTDERQYQTFSCIWNGTTSPPPYSHGCYDNHYPCTTTTVAR